MAHTRRMVLVLAMGSGLAGCTWLGLAEEEETAQPADPAGGAARSREPVARVEAIELGRTRDGIAVAAFGIAPGLGYARPRLVPRRDGAPAPGGYLEFDFFALPPDPDRDLPRGEPSARRLRADRLIPERDLAGVRGLRIYALEGGRQLSF